MSQRTPLHRVHQYARDVLSGKIVAGPLVRLACERHERDLKEATQKGFIFHEAAADHVFEFIETDLRLPDTSDEHGEAKPFTLEPWQAFIVGSLFGWKWVTSGHRRFRNAYIEIGKGNGKTPMLAAVGLYGLMMDGQKAPEIYAAAADRDQAMIMYRDAVRMVDASPALSGRIEKSGIKNVHNMVYGLGFFRAFSREQSSKSGTRPHMGLIDELHEHPNADIVNKIRAGAKGNMDALFPEITNSGSDRTSICFQHHEHSRRILEQAVTDERWYAYVCCLDDKERTEFYHYSGAVQTVVNLCTCSSSVLTQINRIRQEVFAARVTEIGIASKAGIDVQSTPIDQSDQQVSALSAMTEHADSDQNTGERSESVRTDGLRKTLTGSQNTNAIGSNSDPDTDTRKQGNRNSDRSVYQDSSTTSESQRNKDAARSAKRSRGLGLSELTTTTSLEDFEDSSVTTAIRDSVFSEILSKAYSAHSNTCKVTTLAKLQGPLLQVDYPADDPLEDESCHIKVNPNLGVSIHREYLRDQVSAAKNIPTEANTVLRLNFCVWTQQHTRAIDMLQWRACKPLPSDAELAGLPCYAALDLGQSDDFSAFLRMWDLEDGRVAIKARFWIPRSALEQYPHRPYAEWEKAGILEVTDGNTTDYDVIEAAVLEDCQHAGVRQVAYDKRFAEQMAQHLVGAGLDMVDQAQGFQLTEAIRKKGELIVAGDLCHGHNEILNWMASNYVIVHQAKGGGMRPDKDKAADKIDGQVALDMAIAIWVRQPVAPEITAENTAMWL